MKAIDETNKPKKGRPAVDTEAVNLRLSRDIIQALDDFRRAEEDIPNRPEGIRRILTAALSEKGYLKK
ncbi:hypothetical protein CQ054_07010 [Ochrobactrum sp. MYb29]|nr:hypothetical protein CQ054_07010 [Ochrobactrum sp. MYb29]